ncbi:phosphoserine phosphatase SerB [Shewanella maritima]|uniref:phosphoserine phosphatase SerB n=1 Tax=Shewanella maritima TaxID=2520507 RepID=UPI0037355FA9
MSSFENQAVLSWLFHQESASLKVNQVHFSRYQEADYANFSAKFDYRLRIVFTTQAAQQLDAWLGQLSIQSAICVLNRANDLQGIELSFNQDITPSLSELTSSTQLEYFWVKQPLAKLHQPGLLVMDMDSTAIEIECIDELAKMAGVGDAVSQVTAQAMRGELDFEQSLRARVSKLKDAPATIIDQLCSQLPIMPGLPASLSELQDNGWRLVVASGGFTPFVNDLKRKLKLDAAYANELVIENDRLTGEVTGTVVDAEYKAKVVKHSSQQWGIEFEQTVSIGDGANDIPMIEAAALGLAFHAKPKLKQHANVAISHLDLRALVFCLQG